MFSEIKKLRNFLGPNVVLYLFVSSIIGIVWFLVESSFVLMIQGFLLAIGLLKAEQVFLPSWYPTSLSASIILLIGFALIRALAVMAKNHIGFLAQVSFTSQQREKLLKLSLKNANLISSREVLSLYSEIITQSGSTISNCSMLINVGCSMFLFFVTGVKLAPYEMLIGVGSLFVFLIPIRALTGKIGTLGVGLVAEWEFVIGALMQGLKNYYFLLVYKQIDSEINKGVRSIKNYQINYTKYSLIAGVASAFPMFVGVIILSFITYISIRNFKTEPMKLISFFYLFIRFAQSAGEAGSTFSNLKLNLPSIKKLYAWCEKIEKHECDARRKKVDIDERRVQIEVEDISFGYDENKKIISNLSFALGAGDALVIKGESGSGKSTLLSLLLGVIVPNEGSIKINGLSTSKCELSLQSVLAYVGPEPYLVPGTVRENLIYGLDENHKVLEEEIWEALRLVELDEIIFGLRGKLNEQINDIAQLSTGQKQRLSIARAILRKPSLLILDEATANLDVSTEKKIIKNLDHFFKSCTSVIVTHKNSFDGLATKEIALEKIN